jgi:hypothetical protein
MDFSFAHPAFLWALPAAAAPVLLHWLTRPRPKPLPFSSLDLLREAVRARLARSRLRDALLLALRCLLLAALCLLFSRPVAHWGGAADAEGGLTTVLMVDASYSMRSVEAGLSAFERARAAAREILDSAGPRDRAALVAFSDRVEVSVPPTEDFPRLREALDRLSPTARPTRAVPALEAAYNLLEGVEGRRAIVLLSDLAEHGWRDAAPERFRDRDPSVRFVAAETAPESPNAEVADVVVRADGGGKLSHGWASVRFHAGRAAPRGWRLSFGSRLGAQGALSPGEPASFSFASALARGGAGVFALDPDALALDDKFYFPLAPARDFSVLIVNGSPALSPAKDETFFLASAQAALASAGVRFRTVPADGWEPESLAGVDVAALLNVAALRPAAAAALRDHLGAGRGVWITAGENLLPDAAPASLAPGKFVARARVKGRLRPPAGADAHPLGRALAGEEGFEWDNVMVDELWEFRPADDAAVLLATENGAPVLVAGRALGGPVAVLTTTIDRDWTNLPSKPLFPVLCRQTLAYLAGRVSAPEGRRLLAGQPYEETLEDASVSSVDVLRPDGTADAAPVRGRKLRYEKTDEPGVYRVTGGREGRDLAAFAVNVDAGSGEGDPARIPEGRLEGLIPAREVLWVRYPEPAAAKFRERVRGKDLTSALALAALALFALETLLAGALSFRLRRAAAALLLGALAAPLAAQEPEAVAAPAQERGDGDRPAAVAENRFVYAQLRHSGEWDPYPGVWEQFAPTLVNSTSLTPWPERRALSAEDPRLFESPFLVLLGRGPVAFSESEGRALRNYLSGGGFLLIDNSEAEKNSPFARSATAFVEGLFPDARWETLPSDHVVYRSFFLLFGASGRRIVEPSLKGLRVQGRVAAVYCANDLHGALARDRLGNALYACEPGGEPQRLESLKLLLNAVLFSLTGTYKTDAIHQPFLEQKLRQ